VCVWECIPVCGGGLGVVCRKFLTGSYNNNFVIHSQEEKRSVTIEALKDPPPRRLQPPPSPSPALPKSPNSPVPTPSSPKQKKGGAAPANSNSNSAASGKAPAAKPDSKSASKADPKKQGKGLPNGGGGGGSAGPADADVPNVNQMDFGKKALHVAWHPKTDVVAVAGLNKLYLYQMT
jgi:hypothetical protein